MSFPFAGTSSPRPPGSNPASTDSTASQATARLDVSDLGSVVWKLFSAGLAPSTRQNYRTGTKRYIKFCRAHLFVTPFPTSEQTLSHFVAWFHTQHLSCSTVKKYLAAVHHSQITLGLGYPKMGSMAQLEYVIRG